VNNFDSYKKTALANGLTEEQAIKAASLHTGGSLQSYALLKAKADEAAKSLDAALLGLGGGAHSTSQSLTAYKAALGILSEGPFGKLYKSYAVGDIGPNGHPVLSAYSNAPPLPPIVKPGKPDTITPSNQSSQEGPTMSDLKIYRFGSVVNTPPDPDTHKIILGGKGAGLAAMTQAGIPVPPGYTIPTSASVAYMSPGIHSEFNAKINGLIEEGESFLGSQFDNLPLVSVRSGARVSMPGMMDTILNVGLTTETLPFWENKIGKRAALDSYRRLIQMYSSVALEVPMKLFEDQLEEMKADAGVKFDYELDEEHLARLVKRYKQIVVDQTDEHFPDTREAQLRGAVFAVFDSWNNPRAIKFRAIEGIPDDWGTAVTVQAMVFGNVNDKSCTGVAFTRSNKNGDKAPVGDWLPNAQGEDVVAGIRDTFPLEALFDWNEKIALELALIMTKLETTSKEAQDLEFTVENGKLYILQTRKAKTSALAAFNIAYDMAQEGLITKQEACARITLDQFLVVMKDTIDPAFKTKPDFTGIKAGGTIVTGEAMFSSEAAVNCTGPCILVRKETDPDDIDGIKAAVGILTATGGTTSHAAVVANGMNKTCVVGASDLAISGTTAFYPAGKFKQGDKITIDGTTGSVWVKIDVPVIPGGAGAKVRAVVGWMHDGTYAARAELWQGMTAADILDAIAACTSDVVYIDTCMLEALDGNKKTLVNNLTTLKVALDVCKAKTIILDLSSATATYTTADAAMLKLFGQDPAVYGAAAEGVKATVITAGDWDMTLRTRCRVKVQHASAGTRDLLKGGGYKVIASSQIKTFADLLDADGDIAVDPNVLATVFGTIGAFNKAVDMVKAAGGLKTSEPLPTPAYWFQPIFKGA
jgi:phosphohistidine swiveling domain-containing protein